MSAVQSWRAGCADAAVVCNVKVVSDKVEDVSSFDAWKKSVIKDGMSDEQKALAAWEAVVKFRHHDSNPNEFVGLSDSATVDAFKLFNVYGYCRGSGAQPAFLQLVRQLGYDARAWTVNRWGVPEIQYGGAWHMFDPGMICYYKNADGKVASVEELVASVKGFLEKNPGMQGNDAKIKTFQKDPGFKKGPELLVNCPTYDANGNYPLNYFGWFSAMFLYDGSGNTPFLYEEAASQGYRVNIQLRRGEKITRNWSNKGLHIDAADGGQVECLKLQPGKGALYYTPKFGDLSNGRVGNGMHEYTPPFTDPNVLDAFLSTQNVELKARDNAPGAIHVKDAAKPATLVLHMSSSYVYLTGELNFDAVLGGGGSIGVSFSDNNGIGWREIGKFTASGATKIDLSKDVLRRYDYRLKFTLNGKDTGLDSLKIVHDIQHSQRALPALGKGENKIAFSAGPAESTLTIEGAGPKFKGKQVTYDEFGVTLNNISKETLAQWGTWVPQGGSGDVTFPVETPADLLRLRFGCNYRAGQKGEIWDLQVSFDEGKTFKSAGQAEGPTRQNSKWVTLSDIPAGTRKALVRFNGVSRGNLVLFRYRIDADYAEPHGGQAPVKVTYQWNESGKPKEDVHLCKTPEENYTINCEEKPELKSIVLERE